MLPGFFLCSNSSCCRKGTQDEEVLSVFKSIMPSSYQYMICSCTKKSAQSINKETGFEADFRINIKTKEDFLKWKNDFHDSSLTTMRLRKTIPIKGERVLYNVEFRCQHNTQPRSLTANLRASSKNTYCGATASVKVNNTVMKKRSFSTAKDPHLHEYQTYVHLNFIHNHPISIADTLKHRDVSHQTRKRLEELLLSGYRPAAALNLFKYDLQMEDQENYIFNSADRSKCPDKQYVYRLSYQLFAERYGRNHSSESQISALQNFIQSINSKQEDSHESLAKSSCQENGNSSQVSESPKQVDIVQMQVTDDNQVVVAICTPMMRRVHQYIKHSSELMFCDASGNMDRDQCRVFVLLTHSVMGGLPLGILIVTNESQQTIKTALNLFKGMLGNTAFYGRGEKGPTIIMTDDSKAERQALHSVYPTAMLLLCVFRVLKHTGGISGMRRIVFQEMFDHTCSVF